MANEFIARKGLIALSNSEVTGSLGLSGDLTVSGGDIVLGTTSIFSGGNTTSLNNIDAIDATTEATIEAAIDTLANLTSVQGQTVTLGGNLVTQNNNVTINAVGAARTLTLNESLTVGDGNDGTITFSGASKTLTVEDTSVVNQDLTTDASPQFTGIELGHASDTTITRASSGDLAIEGNAIYRAGGTDVPVADGGTGASTAAAAATALGVGTGDSPQFTTVNVGHASDTTLARSSAGVLTVEGNRIFHAGGTDVPVADGGTGASSLTDGGVLLGSGTGAVTAMAVLANGEMIVGDGTTDPVAESGATLRTSIGVGTADNVSFDTGSFTGDLTVTGNLMVQGATTQIQTAQLYVEDKLIQVASGSANSTAADGAGIEIDMAGQTNPSMIWDHTNQEIEFNYPISGSQISGSYFGDGSGLSNIVSTLNTVGESGTGAIALKTQTLTVTGGEGIDTVASNQTITISGEDASTTNKGIVELATNAETNTGTDTARAVTPAALTAWTGDTALVTVGTIGTGTWEGTTVAVDQGGTGATSLNNLITLTTHTTGNYVATVTAGTGLTSTGATSGEGIAHSLSVDAAQTQITSVGTLAAGAISSGFGAIDIGTSALAAGATTIDGALNESTSTTVATGDSETTSVVATVAVASYSSAQFDYSVNDGTNYRAGTCMVIWKAGASINFTDYSTPDIGDTSDATFTVDESGGNARLKFTSSAGTWTVKVITRTL
jgi:hypothetical protein